MQDTARGELTVDDLADLSRDLRADPDLLAVHSLSLSVDSRNELWPAGVVIDSARL